MCYFLDLRSDSRVAKFISHKLVALIIAVIQHIMGVSGILALIAPSDAIKQQLNNSPNGAIAFAVIFLLLRIAFSTLLIVMILKNNMFYVHVYCIFIMVMVVLLIVSIVVNIFTQPKRFGVSGFLSSVLIAFTTPLEISDTTH